ncbi:MAG: hypothetical protein HS104_25935 [Polyangiaceae bacterium]|nr:hypothetical protein [Polyangiaceae bacterium]MCE7888992.1 hypothetical protein [Sorangiineae bacterium PRO1]
MLGVLGASGLLGWRMSGRRTGGKEPCGPLLAYRQGVGAGAAAARPGDAVWLGVMTLPARERDRVLELMSGLLTALEARTSPTGLDLVSGDLREELAEVRGWFVPVMNAAQEVIQERWVAHDVAVRILREAARPADGERLLAAWPSSTPEDELARRARFAAWPITGGALVSGLSPGQRERVRDALRARIPSTVSALALVIDSDLQARRDAPAALRSLQQDCRERQTHLRKVRDRDAWSLAALAEADDAPLLPWLPLGTGELLVVPRLGALARSAELRSEVVDALAAARAQGRIACAPAG